MSLIKSIAKFPVLLVSFLFISSLARTQDTTNIIIEGIPLSEITGEVTKMNQLIRSTQLKLFGESERVIFTTETDTILFSLHLLREDPRINVIENLNFRSLANLENEWNILSSRLGSRQNELSGIVENLEEERLMLRGHKKIWQATYELSETLQATQILVDQVLTTIDKIDTLENRIGANSEFIQKKLVQVSNGMIFCNNILEDISKAKDEVTRQLFNLNQDPVWKMFKKDTLTSPLAARRSLTSDIRMQLKDFGLNNQFKFVLHLIILFILFIAISYLFKDLRSNIPEADSKEIQIIKNIINRPFSASLLISLLLTYLIYGSLPAFVGLINIIFLLIPVIIILNDIFPEKSRGYIYLPVVALLMVQLHSLGFNDTAGSRIFLLIIILASLASIYIIVRRRTFRSIRSGYYGRFLYTLSLGTIVLLGVSFIGSIAGAVMLAEFLTYALIRSAALLLVFYTLSLTANSIIYTAIFGKYFQKLNLVAQYKENIYSTLSRLINLITWVFWFVFSLRFFNVWDKIYSVIKGFLVNEFKVGNIGLSIGSMLLFLFIIWLTIWISRMVKVVIEGEIAPRIKMKRGVPGAISLMLRIIIITIGFLFAIAAAGFGMDNLTIMLGALGVGIGFGLQNIFNNLVSGIILAFERPIQEGDIIEVGELWGTVKEIGIRASTVFTFDGAEVIVPNGNLISNELINWTLTDRNRRVEVLVGVAYGTDPDRVLELLRGVSETHEDIKKEPAPLALFSGFGESSLDFKLLFWIARADNRFIIQSDVNVEVNRAIRKAGIEIPFPQRDLHVRSVDKDVKFKS